MNLSHTAHLLLDMAATAGFEWSIGIGHEGTAFRIGTIVGFVTVSAAPDTDEVAWHWSVLAPHGHRAAAASSIVRNHEDSGLLVGRLRLEPLGPGETADARFSYVGGVVTDGGGPSERELAELLLLDTARLLEVVEGWEGFVRLRERSDRSIAAHEADWPAGLAALQDDSTSTAMLGIVFERFAGNAIHEHVFFHPNADSSLRHRIVSDWDDAAGPDRPQPYGDPDAPSEHFSSRRTESLEYLLAAEA